MNRDLTRAEAKELGWGINIHTREICNYDGKLNKIIFPNTIDGEPVLKTWGTLFTGKKIGEVVLPNNLTNVAQYMFSGTGLASIIIPKTVETIGEEGFKDCNLSELELPESIKELHYKSL